MPVRLNLAALTAEELQNLYGVGGAQAALPDVSQARLAGRPLPGPEVQKELHFTPVEERAWGASPEQSRGLAAEDQAVRALGGSPLGVFYAPFISEARHQRAYLLEPDTALALRWSETPNAPAGSAQALRPFLHAVTWLKDRSGGVSCVLTTAAPWTPTPTVSEQIDLHRHPDQSAEALLDHHRLHVLRHGRGQKIVAGEGGGEAAWIKTWQAVHALNVAAWQRRGLLLNTDS